MVGAFKVDNRDTAFLPANRTMLAADAIAGRPQMTLFAAADEELRLGDRDFASLIFSADDYEFDFHCLTFACRNRKSSIMIKTETKFKEKPKLQLLHRIFQVWFAILLSARASGNFNTYLHLDGNKLLTKSQNTYYLIMGKWQVAYRL